MFAVYVLFISNQNSSTWRFVSCKPTHSAKGRGEKKETIQYELQCIEREEEWKCTCYDWSLSKSQLTWHLFKILMVELWESTKGNSCRPNQSNDHTQRSLHRGVNNGMVRCGTDMPYSSRGKPLKLNSCIIPSTEGMVTWLEPSCTPAPWHTCMRTPVMLP